MAADPFWPGRLFRLALFVWPAPARRRHGEEAEATFASRVRERRASRRPWLLFVIGEIAGSAFAGLRERLRASDAALGSPSPRGSSMEGLSQDLHFSVRALRRNPFFAAIVVLVLALGIGANTAIFSVVNAVLIRPLPGHAPDRLVTIRETNPEFGWTAQVAAPANMLDWREGVAAFEDIAGYGTMGNATLTGEGEPEIVRSAQVTGNFFDVLGVAAARGRVLREAETWSTEPRVVVISDGWWSRRFGRDPDILGRRLTLNGADWEVVGVMPRGFAFPSEDIDVWAPFRFDPASREAVFFRRAHWVHTVARLRPGVSVEQADAELQVVVRRLSEMYPGTNRVMGARVHPLHAFLVQEARTPLLLLQGAVVLLLIVACANAGNLMLVRTAGRRRELAVRAALGAGGGRVARLLLMESVLLALAGGVLGTALGFAAIRALMGLMPPTLPRVETIGIDARVLLFALGLTAISALVFGAVPALKAARTSPFESMRDGARGSTAGRSALRASGMLVVAETAVALVLVLGAGLLVRSFVALRHVDPGFSLEDRTTARISLPGTRYDSAHKVLRFYEGTLEAVRNAPGVHSAGMSSYLPLLGFSFTSQFVVEGWPPGEWAAEVMHQRVTPGWFETMGIDLVAGRFIEETDVADSEPVLVINETLRRQAFGDEDPIGRRMAFTQEPTEATLWWRVVGVIADVRQTSVNAPARIEVYKPVRQEPTSTMAITVHGSIPHSELTRIVRTAVAEQDPDIPLADIRTLEEIHARALRQDRFLLTLVGGFATLALVLAALGVYGVASQAARRRTQEIGIRMALGARKADVMRLILRQGFVLVLLGVVAGLLGGLGVTRVMESVLYGVAPRDPLTFLVVPLVLVLVAVGATALPALGATRADPLAALRAE